MKSKKLIILAISASLVAGCATAGRYDNDRYDRRYRDDSYHEFIDKAKVVSASPIYETVRINEPETRCWNETVHHGRHNNRNESYTPTIAGAILGGAAGHQFGKGDGKDVMTVAGMLLGGSIGNDMGKKTVRGGRYSTTEKRCETVDNYRETRDLVGYNVQYKYRGKNYWTETVSDPGKYLKLKVTVMPLE
jgi:uncharacterized protein YcfJ